MENKKTEFWNLTNLFIMLLVGTIVGTSVLNRTENYEFFTKYFYSGGFIPDVGFLNVLKNSLISSEILLILFFCSGVSAFSQPLSILILLYRGFTLGISISYVYRELNTKGIITVLILIIPFAILTSIILTLAARESIRSANVFWGTVFKKESNTFEFKLYTIKFIVLAIMILLAALLQGVLSLIFGKLI